MCVYWFSHSHIFMYELVWRLDTLTYYVLFWYLVQFDRWSFDFSVFSISHPYYNYSSSLSVLPSNSAIYDQYCRRKFDQSDQFRCNNSFELISRRPRFFPSFLFSFFSPFSADFYLFSFFYVCTCECILCNDSTSIPQTIITYHRVSHQAAMCSYPRALFIYFHKLSILCIFFRRFSSSISIPVCINAYPFFMQF